MPIERIPVVASVDPEANTEVYYESGELSVNTMYDKYSQDRFYATQRPSVKTIASDRQFTTETTGDYDLSGAAYDNVSTSLSVAWARAGIWFKPDGTEMYNLIAGTSQGDFIQHTLSTPWDITTASLTHTEDVTGNSLYGLAINDAGNKVYFTSRTDVTVRQYSLTTSWDASTLTFVQSLDISAQFTAPKDVFFRDSGETLFVIGRASSGDDIIAEYSLSTALDISTATHVKSFNLSNILNLTEALSFFINGTGTKGIISDSDFGYEITFGTAGDISTITDSGNSFNFNGSSGDIIGLFVQPSAEKFFANAANVGKVFQYSLPTNTETVESEVEEKGRALYHWEKTQQSYIVINDTIYVDSNSELATISDGLEKCFFVETDDYLVLLDPENNEGWTINEANVVEKITHEDFPPNFATPEQLAGGGAWVDGFLFILTEEGFVWNSVINDPRSWNALNFLGADRMSDEGVYLSRHAEGLVAIGTRSTEFFYNAGLETGSPLTRRQDLSYYVGCPNRNYVFNTGETVYFIGNEEVGTLGAFTINKYQLEKVSNKTIDTLLTTSFNDKGVDFLVTGAMITNHLLFFVSALIAGDVYTAEYSLVFDVFADKWTRYETSILDKGHFPIVGFAGRLRDRTTNTVVLFVNGEYGQMTLDYTVQDFLEGGPYFAEGVDYIEDQEDYVQTLEGDDAVVPFTIRLGEVDFDTMTNKFVYRAEVVGTTLADSQGLDPIQVRWSDDHYNTFTEYRNLDTSFRSKLTRCGKFRRRAHEIHYEGVEPLRIEGIELYLRGSSYA